MAGIQVIRGYELNECLGRGGFGAVYRASQPSVGREVAIKVILPEFADHPDFIRRFESEAQLVARLEHPYIVPLYDYWREPGGAYLVMRYLRGGSLRESLERNPVWSLEAVVRLLDQIAGALASAHRQQVVHRDIKPANILLDEEGNAYLSDFGIAKDISRAGGDTEGAVTGSLAYLSPEQARSLPVSAASDVYSLGLVIYELLAGEHAYAGSALGELLMKQLTAGLPSLLRRRPDLPAALDEVLQTATAKEPALRFPSAPAYATAFRRAAFGAPGTAAPGSITPIAAAPLPAPPETTPLEAANPYKGLRAFQEADAGDFFGREALTRRLLARLAEDGPASRFLAVVGPSGSGKSSLVRAGLLPALRRGALPGSDKWFVVEMLPGAHPLEELEVGLLRISARHPGGLMDQLRRDPRGLLRAARLALPEDESQLLLIVDQFEEVFTLVEDRAESLHFLNSLYAAVTEPRSPLRVIVTLRADFYDRPLLYPDFSSLMQVRTEVVTPLTTEELAQAIRLPAEGVGGVLEPGLVTAIVADVNEQPGALPLVQFALTELFARRRGRLLTRAAYEELGGVTGVLGGQAEEVFARLDPAGQTAAQQLFLRLITLGEGSEDTRRRVLLSELLSLDLPPGSAREDMQAVIDAFGRQRLLSFDRDPQTRSPTVEVAHEALLREWRRLREWLDASRTDVRLQRLLSAAAAEWQQAGRDPSFLLRGARLDQFEGWAAGTRLALTQDERFFLEACLSERHAQQAAEQARRQRELEAAQKLAEAERSRAEEQTRAADQLRRRAIFLSVALGVAILLGVVALIFWRQADTNMQQASRSAAAAQVAEALALERGATAQAANTQVVAEMNTRATAEAVAVQQRSAAEEAARLAAARELAAAAISNLEVDPELSLLLALEGAQRADTREVVEALHRSLQSNRLQRTLRLTPENDAIQSVAYSPDGARLATTSHAGRAVVVWDAASGEKLLELSLPDPAISVAYSPDGARLATGSSTGRLQVWDAATGAELLNREAHPAPLSDLAFTPDGSQLVSAGYDGLARLWDLASGEELLSFNGHEGVIRRVVISPDGTRLASAGWDDTVRVWDLQTAAELLVQTRHTDAVWSLAYSPDGRYLASAAADLNLLIWDAASGKVLGSLVNPHSATIAGLAFSPDGTRLASGSLDGVVRLWNLAQDSEENFILSPAYLLAGHTLDVLDLEFSPQCVAPPAAPFETCGPLLATASKDGSARIWDISPAGGREVLTVPGYRAAISPDGARLASVDLLGESEFVVHTWDMSTGVQLSAMPVEGPPGGIYAWDFNRDQTRLAYLAGEMTAHVVDLTGPARELASFSLGGHEAIVINIALSPDGSRVATASYGEKGMVKLWDAASGREVGTFAGPPMAHTLTFSPDGSKLGVIGQGSSMIVLDVTGGQELFKRSEGFMSLAFSPDSTRLAAGDYTGAARVWDLVSGEELFKLSGHFAAVASVNFSPDDRRLLTSGLDGRIKLWELASGEELLVLQSPDPQDVAFSPDGAQLLAYGDYGITRVYLLDTEALVALAKSRVQRPLSLAECRRYLHVEQCPAE